MSRLDRYIKAFAGPNPKEAGVDPEDLKKGLQARMRKSTWIIAISGLIGFTIVALYVYG